MAELASGVAVLFDIEGDFARAGVLHEKLGRWFAIPMGHVLARGTEIPVDRDSVLSLRDLQRTLPPRKPHVPFEPVVVCRAGVLVLQRATDDETRYRIFEVLHDAIHVLGDTEADLVQVRLIRPNGSAVDVIETFDLRDVQSLSSLVFEAEAQYQNPPDRFWYIVATPIVMSWNVEMSAIGTFPSKRIEGPSAISLSDGALSITMNAPEQPLFADEPRPVSTDTVYRKLVRGSIEPMTGDLPSWRLDDVQYTSVSLNNSRPDASFSFHATSLSITYAVGTPSATRETFRGLDFKAFSGRLVPEGFRHWDMLTARNVYIVSLFGRDSRIMQAQSGYLALVHDGPPFATSELEEIQTVLQYLGGKRAQHFSTETFDAERRLTFNFRERSMPTSRGLAPIRLDYWSDENADRLGRELSSMVMASSTLRSKSPNGIAAAFHHYFEGVNSSYAVSRTLMLAVAIDALITAHVGNQKQAMLFEKNVFRKLVKPLRKAAKIALEEAKIEKSAAARFVTKLDNLNFASAAQRQSAFWKSLGIILTADELEILKSRHDVVHEGHLGFEHSPEALWENYRRSNALATLFNRAMLTLLGWTGGCLDHRDLEQKTEIPLTTAMIDPQT